LNPCFYIGSREFKTLDMEIRNPKEHVLALMTEIQVLRSRIEPTDTGHLHTAINVLEERIQELLNSMQNGSGI